MTIKGLACALWRYKYVDVFFEEELQRQQVWDTILEITTDNKICDTLQMHDMLLSINSVH